MIPLSEIEQCGVLSLATMDEESGVRRRQGEESRTVYSLSGEPLQTKRWRAVQCDDAGLILVRRI